MIEYRDSKYGYIDKTGKIVIKPQFRRAEDFSRGVAAVQLWKTGEIRWIDTAGRFVPPPRGRSPSFMYEITVPKTEENEWWKRKLVWSSALLVLIAGLFVVKYRRPSKQSPS